MNLKAKNTFVWLLLLSKENKVVTHKLFFQRKTCKNLNIDYVYIIFLVVVATAAIQILTTLKRKTNLQATVATHRQWNCPETNEAAF